VRLDFEAQFSDQPLRLLREKLGQGEGRDPLKRRGPNHGQNEGDQKLQMPLANDVVNQVFRRRGQDEPRRAIDGHQGKSHAKKGATRLDEDPDLGQQFAERR